MADVKQRIWLRFVLGTDNTNQLKNAFIGPDTESLRLGRDIPTIKSPIFNVQ